MKMKTNFTSLKMVNLVTLASVILIMLLSLTGSAQIQNSALVAKFGIDGDLYSDFRQNGTFTAAGSHDWFKTANGTGIGIIDTTGAASLKALLSSGNNIAFTKGSSIPSFTVVDTFLHLDALYARDYNNNDKTSFGAGSKNGDNSAVWGTTPGGGLVQDKSDIIDVYAAMRRNGTKINSTNPSPLILTMGTTILGTTGTRYVDFELFVNKIGYDTITGVFSNAGSVLKGGHEDFQFNADGSLKKFGDLDVSLTYTNSNVTDISIYIWVNVATYQNTFGQQKFNFVPNEFYGAGAGASWGYAKIVAKAGNTLPLWGSVNSGNITGPSWGTASKDLGTSSNNYYFLSNAMGQFSETAVDLTSIGADPAFNNTAGNSCNPPFSRILIKTRSSASFTSALVDFAGPYNFLNAPPASIVNPQPLTCTRSSIILASASIDNSKYYSWSTSNGSIVGKSDTSVITINKPGKYYLSTSVSAGCPPQNKDSVVVRSDNFKPVAAASWSGLINQTFTNTSQLLGGDINLSNYTTPYGLSQGLLWKWSNPKGFTSTLQNPVTADTGRHQLIVTEIRNGCKDTAYTNVLWYKVAILETKFGALTASATASQKVNVQWTMQSEDDNEVYELERSEDGMNFKKVFSVSSMSAGSTSTYHFNDDISLVSSPLIYYRLKIVLASGRNIYSPMVKVVNKEIEKGNYVISMFQKSTGTIQVKYFTKNRLAVELTMMDMSGKILAKAVQQSVNGNNSYLFISSSSMLKNQMVVVKVVIGNEIHTQKIILF